MSSVTSVKAGLTAAQKKMGLNLVFGAMAAVDDPRVSTFRGAIAPLAASVKVDIKGNVSSELLAAIAAANGRVLRRPTPDRRRSSPPR